MAARSGLAFFPLLLTAGAIVLLLFVVLAGVTDSTPFNKTFFLSLDLSKFQGAISSPSGDGHYTLWGICASDDSGNSINCPHASPAYPFDPSTNFAGGTPTNIASSINFFYYMSRFAFAFYLIALVFSAISFLTGLLALCSRLGSAVSTIFAFLGFIFAAAAASLSTAWIVIAKNDLVNAGIDASIGNYAIGFSWGATAALFLASFGFCCVACCCGRRHRTDDEFATTPTTTGRTRFWRRKEKVPFDAEHTANGSY